MTKEVFSDKLELVLALAFDISEFSHLVVLLPQLPDHRIALILIMTFSTASTLLLLQMDWGLGSNNSRHKTVWHFLTILLLDGPFLALRVYMIVLFPESVETFQLVYLLKNFIGVWIGFYQIVQLLCRKPSHSPSPDGWKWASF